MAVVLLVPVFGTLVTEFVLAGAKNEIASQGLLYRQVAMWAFFRILLYPRLTALFPFNKRNPIRSLFTAAGLMGLPSTLEAKACSAAHTSDSLRQAARILKAVLAVHSRAAG